MSLGAIASSYAAAGGGYDPTSAIAWDHAYWVEGSEFAALGLADTNAVATWPDEVATADATQATAGNRPQYLASVTAFNSKPAVKGDGSNDVLRTAAFTTIAQPYSLVIIGNVPAAGGFPTLVGSIDAGARGDVYGRSAGNWAIMAGLEITGGTRNGDPHLFTAYFNGASSLLELDGTSVVSGNANTNSRTGLSLFAIHTAANFNSGHLTFVGIVSGDVRTDGGWADFEAWAETHYGLTIA